MNLPWTHAGVPVTTFPIALDDRVPGMQLPVGVQVAAGFGRDSDPAALVKNLGRPVRALVPTTPCAMKVDLHLHTHFSPDSLSPIHKVMDRARALGFDRIAVTDHNCTWVPGSPGNGIRTSSFPAKRCVRTWAK